jgi:hypothetical protein
MTTTTTSNTSAAASDAANDTSTAFEGPLSGDTHGFVVNQTSTAKKQQAVVDSRAGDGHDNDRVQPIRVQASTVSPSMETAVTRQRRRHEYSPELAKEVIVIDDEKRPDVIVIDDDDVVEPDNLIRAIDDLSALIPRFILPLHESLRTFVATNTVTAAAVTPTLPPLLPHHAEMAHRIELAALRTLLWLKQRAGVLQQQQPFHQRTAAVYLILVRTCQQVLQRRRLANRGTKRPATTTTAKVARKKVRFQEFADKQQQQQQNSDESTAPSTPLAVFTPPDGASLEQVLRELTLLKEIQGEIYQSGVVGPGWRKLQAQPLAFSFCWQLLQDLWSPPIRRSNDSSSTDGSLLPSRAGRRAARQWCTDRVWLEYEAPILRGEPHAASRQVVALAAVRFYQRLDDHGVAWWLDLPRRIQQQESALYQAAADSSAPDWPTLTRRLVTRLRRNEPRDLATLPHASACNLKHQENNDSSGHGLACKGRSLETARESNEDLVNLDCDHRGSDSAISPDLSVLNHDSHLPCSGARALPEPEKGLHEWRYASDDDEPRCRRRVSLEPQQEQEQWACVDTPGPLGNKGKSGDDHGATGAGKNPVVELDGPSRSNCLVRPCKSTAATRLGPSDSAASPSPARYRHDTVREFREDATPEDRQGNPLQGAPPSGVRIRTIPRRFAWKAFPEVSTWSLLCLFRSSILTLSLFY